MPLAETKAVAGPGFVPTADMVNSPHPATRASQVANLADQLRWIQAQLEGWQIASVNGDFAPSDATYVTVALEGDLTNERRLAAETPLAIVDAGAGSTVTVRTTRAHVYGEVPSGAIPGAVFVTFYTPVTGTVRVYVYGQRMQVTTDYTISAATITMNEALPANAKILVDYERTV
jgi:hypothetical protein